MMGLSHAAPGVVRASLPARRPPPAATAGSRWRAVLRLSAPLPFAVTGALYELSRGIFAARGQVHVADLWALEQRLFSVTSADGPRALSDLVASHTSAALDLWCGVTYATFLLESVGACLYLLRRSCAKAWELSLGFLAVNLLGWLIWILYPAAPPWYVDRYGLNAVVLDVVSSPAGLLRFDALLGWPLSETFYSKSANVFGAVPSLHVAYATLVVCVVWSQGKWVRAAALGFALSIAYAAVYLRHHYILDVVAGVLLALLVHGLSWALRRRWSLAPGLRSLGTTTPGARA